MKRFALKFLGFQLTLHFSGSELEVMSDLIVTGAVQYINVSIIELHERLTNDKERKELIQQLQDGIAAVDKISNGGFGLQEVDDETYGGSNFDLPICE